MERNKLGVATHTLTFPQATVAFGPDDVCASCGEPMGEDTLGWYRCLQTVDRDRERAVISMKVEVMRWHSKCDPPDRGV